MKQRSLFAWKCSEREKHARSLRSFARFTGWLSNVAITAIHIAQNTLKERCEKLQCDRGGRARKKPTIINVSVKQFHFVANRLVLISDNGAARFPCATHFTHRRRPRELALLWQPSQRSIETPSIDSHTRRECARRFEKRDRFIVTLADPRTHELCSNWTSRTFPHPLGVKAIPYYVRSHC